MTTSSRGWVSGVRTKGGRGHDASVVVVNADLPWAQRNIAGLGEKGKTEVRGGGPDDSRGYSAGIVEFCWGVRGDDLQALQQHNVFLSSKSSKSFEESWTRPGSKGGDLPEDANFYIHVPSKTDPTAVSGPGPLHSVMVLFPVANKAELQAGVSAARDRQARREGPSLTFSPRNLSSLPPPPSVAGRVRGPGGVEPRFDPEAAQRGRCGPRGQDRGRGRDGPRRVGERVQSAGDFARGDACGELAKHFLTWRPPSTPSPCRFQEWRCLWPGPRPGPAGLVSAQEQGRIEVWCVLCGRVHPPRQRRASRLQVRQVGL